ncbi:MAG: DUF4292 domain-containing protein [Flavobacteriales bacterium]|nr:DUF4292 domain-containing protein [Flavobacteriales bacterium]
MKYLIVVASLLVFLSGCKSTRETAGDRAVPHRKTDEILGLMKEKEVDCHWLSIKYDVEIKSEKFEDSFKMYVRMKQDSVIWISATYYAVEVARFLFLPDTVKFMDRKNNKYYVGDYNYIQDRFKVETNFEILESLLLSNSIKLLEIEAAEGKIRSSKDDGNYYLSFLKKGQLRRALRNEGEATDLELDIGLWVDPNGFRLTKTSITDFESGRNLVAEYTDYKELCNTTFPNVTLYTAQSANEQAEVKTSVMKITTGKEVSLSFTIPEKYEALVP